MSDAPTYDVLAWRLTGMQKDLQDAHDALALSQRQVVDLIHDCDNLKARIAELEKDRERLYAENAALKAGMSEGVCG